MWEFNEKNMTHSALRPLCEKYAKKDQVAYDMGCGFNIFPSVVLTDYVRKVYAVDKEPYKLRSFEERLRKELKGKSLPIETINTKIEYFESENGTVKVNVYGPAVKAGLPKADVVLFHHPTFLRFSERPLKRDNQLFTFRLGVKSMHQLMRLEGYLLILGLPGELESFYEIAKDELKGFSEVEKDLTSIDDAYLVIQKTK